jgi:hypothetical protein
MARERLRNTALNSITKNMRRFVIAWRRWLRAERRFCRAVPEICPVDES